MPSVGSTAQIEPLRYVPPHYAAQPSGRSNTPPLRNEHAWEHCHIEGETDDLYDAARSRLYEVKGPAGALHFWVSSEILDHLERVMDRLEDMANEIHGTMIEHV